jgi:hypothetical protein
MMMNLRQLEKYSQDMTDTFKRYKAEGQDYNAQVVAEARARVAFADLEAYRASVRGGILTGEELVEVTQPIATYDEAVYIINKGYISPISYDQLAASYNTNVIRNGELLKVAPNIGVGLPSNVPTDSHPTSVPTYTQGVNIPKDGSVLMQTQALQPPPSKTIDLKSPLVKYVGVGVALFIIFRLIRKRG